MRLMEKFSEEYNKQFEDSGGGGIEIVGQLITLVLWYTDSIIFLEEKIFLETRFENVQYCVL